MRHNECKIERIQLFSFCKDIKETQTKSLFLLIFLWGGWKIVIITYMNKNLWGSLIIFNYAKEFQDQVLLKILYRYPKFLVSLSHHHLDSEPMKHKLCPQKGAQKSFSVLVCSFRQCEVFFLLGERVVSHLFSF